MILINRGSNDQCLPETLKPKDCTGGGQNFARLASGHWFAYNTLNVPVNGRYTVSLRVLSTAPAQVKVGHSGLTFGIIDIPSTGGVWQTISDTITWMMPFIALSNYLIVMAG